MRSWPICPSSSPQRLSCSSTSRPPRRSASNCQRHCLRALMILSNDRVLLHCMSPEAALLGPRRLSDLSLHMWPKRTLIRSLSSIAALPVPGSKRPVNLVTAAILCFAGVYAEAAEIHDGETGYIAKNSIWFTDESDLSVWKRVRQTFAPKDVKTYQQI